MTAYRFKLTDKIIIAFILLGLVILIATGIGLHYLNGIRLYQLEFEEEWSEYQRMVYAEDILKDISTDASAWQAGLVPVTALRSKAAQITNLLSMWAIDEYRERHSLGSRLKERIKHEQQESRLLVPARLAFVDLNTAIAALHSKSTGKTAVSLVHSLDRLQQTIGPLRRFYFESIRSSLARAQKARYKAQRESIYFIIIVALLLLAISTYSIRILKRQTKQLIEQERQIASAALVQQLAHEIRNPLGIVKSAASVIVKRSTGEVVGLAEDISSEVGRVDELLTDLLHLHHQDNRPKIVTDISSVVQKVAELFTPKISAAGLKLEIDNKAPGVRLLCNAGAIKQALMNLLLNAIEASHQQDLIEITMMAAGKEYALKVRDYGVGVSSPEKRRIFDLMYTTKPYGFGIGLTVVKRIVEDHGGRIEVDSPPPRGTAFTIYLPMEA
ncbi:MAG: HAMP domain-containing histidine kinase [Candidatus Omnitrophica bacterium]|nr:HAMP domain-containing histidine kinase [Candidatus Omnitrophota bacterium]